MREGFLCIDKPAGPSSYAIVASVRRQCSGIKVGHAGTLDPAATGLLVLALGRATRLLHYLPLEPKCYLFGIRFGSRTDTLDASGKTVEDGGRIPLMSELEAALNGFSGSMLQTPPEFSAIKIGGVRAYRIAREGGRCKPAPR